MSPKDMSPGPVERLLRRDRSIVLAAVAVIVALAGAYTVMGVGMDMSALDMTRMAPGAGAGKAMPMGMAWSLSHGLLVFFMWWVMMIAMMTPSAAPALLLYAAVKRLGTERVQATALTLWFLLGYLFVWAAFSLLATGLQWTLGQIGLMNDGLMRLNSRLSAGGILLMAGLFQFSGLKDACLSHCQSPAKFLTTHNRPGRGGALRLGVYHGVYCLGCCWALMALLFVGGIMNLWWIVGLAFYVLAEKTLPHSRWLTRGTGALLLGAGGYFALTGL